MRRAQAEMIGLVLIVLLLAVGFLLYVKFTYGDDAPGTRQSYEKTQLGATFLSSIAKTDIDCGDATIAVQKLISGIATGQTTVCGHETAEATLSGFLAHDILNRTLDEWGYNYRLAILRQGGVDQPIGGLGPFTNPNVPVRERCAEGMAQTADTYPIATNPGSVILLLGQC